MRHNKKGKKLNRSPSHRKAALRNLAINLFKHKQIKTTLAKAKAVRPFAEKLISSSINGDLSDRRRVAQKLGNRKITNKLFEEIAPHLENGPDGGYLRVLKAGFRKGDGADMAIIGFAHKIESEEEEEEEE